MSDCLLESLSDAGLDPQQFGLVEARLTRESNQITITLSTEESVSSDAEATIRETLQKRLPGFDVRIRLEYAMPCHAAHTPVKEERRPASAYAEVAPRKGDDRVLYGDLISAAETVVPMDELNSTRGADNKKITVEGAIISLEMLEWKGNGKFVDQNARLRICLSDWSDSVYCMVALADKERRARLFEQLDKIRKAEQRIAVSGNCYTARFEQELQIRVSDINRRTTVLREDQAADKRVELHLHTKMSMMDAITDVKAAVRTAKRWGHRAIAVTDHGVVQAFPALAKAADECGIKPIFGVEGYLNVDSELIPIPKEFVVFDLETTGLKAEQCEILEIGAVRICNGLITDRFQTFIDDGVLIPSTISKLTGITNDMLNGAPSTRAALIAFGEFVGDDCLVAHNAAFDMGFLAFHGGRFDMEFSMPYADTFMLSRYLLRDMPNYKLDSICDRLGITLEQHHRAIDDAAATGEIFIRLLELLRQQKTDMLPVHFTQRDEIKPAGRKKRARTYHVIILAKTQEGLKNLYRIVSLAHLNHFHAKPTVPKSLLSVYRDGLIIGSACEQGELYQAILNGGEEGEIEKIARFYDYLEIQPLSNNVFMVREGIVKDEAALMEINRRIVSLGDRLGLPVAATDDAHFLNPQDAVYRKILLYKLGFKDAEYQPLLHFKTTDEMLEAFSYLGEDVARRVVIETTNAIADSCEKLKPFPDGTHAPKIPNAEEELTERTMARAHEIYGDPLPKIVQDRLDKELRSIITNGFASLYLMAQRLVHKSLSDGYLVGSRGSVGSSLVAMMAGITEVNALAPHYVCPKCQFSDFDVAESGSSCGADMPDRACPCCGAELHKEGFEIPFEVFLGFKGDKTPDIDLNFSGEYQPVAHKYVEEMFGVGHAFRAGTISGIGDSKARECVYHYGEVSGRALRRAEVERLAQGCLDVKVTTGQHPGGIVIVPKNDDILDYTPIQYPADKLNARTITTHFDFHAMDDRLVKLDILGHDDPTALRMLEDITGKNPREIPLSDPVTRQIFSTTEPLEIDLTALNCTVGTIAVPEFGTGFVRQVLEKTKPTTIEELVRIAGLTHGENVWNDNAEPLIMNGVAKLSEVICTRDDILNYLIARGMDASLSFKIMEGVRKGKGLKPEQETAMKQSAIPAWFIDSCKKIKYMFPRGHAVAYAMMSFRIAYYKVHYPLAFYAVYFTVRADNFDIMLASGGPDAILGHIKEIENGMQDKSAAAKKRDKDIITILEVVYEMNLRGIELLPIDIYASKALKFTVEGNAIRPPFNAIPGIGGNAAQALEDNRGGVRFSSVEDYRNRTQASTAVIASMRQCGCFRELPETDQISLF